jgi:hypothetical protein
MPLAIVYDAGGNPPLKTFGSQNGRHRGGVDKEKSSYLRNRTEGIFASGVR